MISEKEIHYIKKKNVRVFNECMKLIKWLSSLFLVSLLKKVKGWGKKKIKTVLNN